MVLEDSSTEPQDGWTDDASPSADDDSFAGTASSSSNRYHIDMEKLPQPFSFNRPRARQNMSQRLEKSLDKWSEDVRRSLTLDEVQAISYIECGSLRTASWSIPIFGSMGAARCYQTARTFRFPLFQPDPTTFNPNSFFGLVRGSTARVLWHLIRTSTYCGVVGLSGVFLFAAPYATAVGTFRLATDPRLQQFKQDLVRASQEKRAEIMQRAGIQGADPSRQGRVRSQQPPGSGSTRSSQDDDMSPTSSDYTFQGDGYSKAETGTMTDSQSRSHEQRYQSTQPPPSDSSSSSPSTAASSSNSSGGSAWDHIRAQAARGKTTAGAQAESPWSKVRGNRNEARGEDQSNATSGEDSFSYSNTDEERALAKSEAQKEFDARIERERRGKDF